MSKIVSWGRWLVAISFAYQGLGILFVIEAIVVFVALKLNERMLFPALFALAVSAPLLACAWGIIKMRGWAYRLAIAFAFLEVLAAILTVLAWRAKVTWLYLGGISVHIGPGFILALLPVTLSLVWLLLPSVRTAYWRRERLA